MAFGSSYLIVLRESLEAFLILGILLGMTTRLGHPGGRRPLYTGALVGLGLSILLGLGISAGAEALFERGEEGFEGIASLFAVAVLTYMIVWMYKHTRDLMGTLHHKTRLALEGGKHSALFALSFVAVLREGIETVLFIGTQVQQEALTTVLSVLLGIATAGLVAYLLFTGALRLSIKNFFAVTGFLLVLVAGGLLSTGVHEMMEQGWLPDTGIAYDISHVLDQDSTVGGLLKATFGYRDHPRWLEAAVWSAYVGGMGAWYLRPVLRNQAPAVRPVAVEEE